MTGNRLREDVKISKWALVKSDFNILVGVFCVAVMVMKLIYEPIPSFSGEHAMTLNLIAMVWFTVPGLVGVLNLLIGFFTYPSRDNPNGRRFYF